jgi:hypothetical protein
LTLKENISYLLQTEFRLEDLNLGLFPILGTEKLEIRLSLVTPEPGSLSAIARLMGPGGFITMLTLSRVPRACTALPSPLQGTDSWTSSGLR